MISARLRPLLVPVAVVEIVLGLAFGPVGLGVLRVTPITGFLSLFGLSYLMFLSGSEVDLTRFFRPGSAEKRTVVTAALLALVILGAGIGAGHLLESGALVHNGLAVGFLIGSAAPTVVLPTLKGSDRLGTDYGQAVLMASLILEVVGLTAVSILASVQAHGPQALLAVFLLLPLALAFRLSTRLRELWVGAGLDAVTSQLGVRGSLAVVLVFIALAETLGTAAVLGAFVAGMTVAVILGDHLETIRDRLDTIGYGYFVPFFFLLLGAGVSLTGSALRVAVITAVLVVVFALIGLIAALLAGWRLRDRRLGLSSGALLATHLSVTVAGTAILGAAGIIDAESATEIILASLVSAMVFPSLALRLLPPVVGERRTILLFGRLGRTLPLARRIRELGHPVRVVDAALPKNALAGAATAVVLGGDDAVNERTARSASEGGVPRVIVETSAAGSQNIRDMGWTPFVPEQAAADLLEILVLAPGGADVLSRGAGGEMADVVVTNPVWHGVELRQVPLPVGVLVVSLARGRDHLVPRGATVLCRDDVLTLIAPPHEVPAVRALLSLMP